jgi:hypothetical protein
MGSAEGKEEKNTTFHIKKTAIPASRRGNSRKFPSVISVYEIPREQKIRAEIQALSIFPVNISTDDPFTQ